MFNLTNLLENGDKIDSAKQLERMRELGPEYRMVEPWLEEVGYGDIDKLVAKIGIGRPAIKVRATKDTRQFIALIVGLMMIDEGHINVSNEMEIMQTVGVKQWLERFTGIGLEEDALEDLGIKKHGLYARRRKSVEQLIATVYGFRYVD